VAVRQLYASHYFQTALDLTVCISDAARPNERGFYLTTVKGSQQDGLTGIKGSIVRNVAVGKTRSSLEETLTAIKEIGIGPSISEPCELRTTRWRFLRSACVFISSPAYFIVPTLQIQPVIYSK
jgi:hypothetical protein